MEHGPQWFADVFRRHATAVHRYFARRAHPGEVDDLTAEVFATAWRRRDDVPDGLELAWLYRTAGYLLAHHRRKARPVRRRGARVGVGLRGGSPLPPRFSSSAG